MAPRSSATGAWVFDGLQSDRFADLRLSTPAFDGGDKLALELIAEAIADLEGEKAFPAPPEITPVVVLPLLRPLWIGKMAAELNDLSDESLLAYYESIRRQVAADVKLGGRHRLIGDSVKQYAERVQQEMQQRQMRFIPIDWR
jgi:hypothetical protein